MERLTTHPADSGSTFAAAASVLLAAIVIAGSLLVPSPSVRGASPSITLYGKAASGWSLTPGGETNPGPGIAVSVLDSVTLHLLSEDGMPHAFFVDMDDNFRVSAGDLLSDSGTDVTYTFTAPNTPGAHYYYCFIHSSDMYGDYRPGGPMFGVFAIHGPPTATFAAPTAATSWTGGSPHEIRFDLTDGEPPTSLTLWINYSANGGSESGSIAGPIAGTANPNVVSWTSVLFDSTSVVVNVTARNSTGSAGYSLTAPFEVDSIGPTITGQAPAPSEINVPLNTNIRVTWSERMNPVATAAAEAFSVRRLSDGAWIGGTSAWSPDGRAMTFTPSPRLDPTTMYEIRVNATARDDSDPGNGITTPDAWSFTTGTFSDTTPPTVASASADPSVQIVGGTVSILADVTDDFQVATVNALVQGPSTDVNLTMTIAVGSTWTASRVYNVAGSYTFTVWAIDSCGNSNSRTGAFSISSGPLPAPSSVSTVEQAGGGAVVVSWSAVNRSEVTGYNVYRSPTAGGPYTKLTAALLPTSGPLRYVDNAVQPGHTYHYAVTAVDSGGTESPYSEESTITVATASNPIPADAGPIILAAIAASGIAVAVLLVFLSRRLRRVAK